MARRAGEAVNRRAAGMPIVKRGIQFLRFLEDATIAADRYPPWMTGERYSLKFAHKNHTNIRNRGRVGACPTDSE